MPLLDSDNSNHNCSDVSIHVPAYSRSFFLHILTAVYPFRLFNYLENCDIVSLLAQFYRLTFSAQAWCCRFHCLVILLAVCPILHHASEVEMLCYHIAFASAIVGCVLMISRQICLVQHNSHAKQSSIGDDRIRRCDLRTSGDNRKATKRQRRLVCPLLSLRHSVI